MADTDIGFGADFQRGTGSPLVYVTVGEVTDFRMPNPKRDTVDATHSKSPNRYREFIGSMRDAGECGFDIQYSDPAALDDLLADFNDDDPKNYRIVFPDLTNWDFIGLVTSVAPEMPIAEKMKAAIDFKVTGQPAFLA
jgi:predicted secreted protein